MLCAMLVVPRIAEWCAFYLADEQGSARLAHVWHSDERMLGPLRAELEAPKASARSRRTRTGYRSSAAEFPLVYGTQRLGTMLLDQAAGPAEPGLAGLLDDLSRRMAFALDRVRGHRREAATSRILQRSLRPAELDDVTGIESSVVYEPAIAECAAGGDFYDLFRAGANRWCLILGILGDVCGNGPQAAAVTGLARHAARLLARDGHGVTAVLDRLNRAVADDCAPDRFLSMLRVEIVPLDAPRGDRPARRRQDAAPAGLGGPPAAAAAAARDRPGRAGGRAPAAPRRGARSLLSRRRGRTGPGRRADLRHRRGHRAHRRHQAARRRRAGQADHRVDGVARGCHRRPDPVRRPRFRGRTVARRRRGACARRAACRALSPGPSGPTGPLRAGPGTPRSSSASTGRRRRAR